jgi:hypothetical protein
MTTPRTVRDEVGAAVARAAADFGAGIEGNGGYTTITVTYIDLGKAAEHESECELCGDPIRPGELFVELYGSGFEPGFGTWTLGFAHLDCADQ